MHVRVCQLGITHLIPQDGPNPWPPVARLLVLGAKRVDVLEGLKQIYRPWTARGEGGVPSLVIVRGRERVS